MSFHPSAQRFMIVLFVGFAWVFTGVLTLQYPPGYLALSQVWAWVFVVAGWVSVMTLVWRHAWLAAVSGGMLVGSALFRGGAIFVELGIDRLFNSVTGRAGEPMSASFSIAGTTWLLIAMLLWFGWPRVQANLISPGEREL